VVIIVSGFVVGLIRSLFEWSSLLCHSTEYCGVFQGYIEYIFRSCRRHICSIVGVCRVVVVRSCEK